MASRRHTATLRDVATLAGVSPFTVSAVLNGARSNTRVSAETRSRIERCAQEVRYVPNASARGLARRRTDTIGVLLGIIDSDTALSDPYATLVLNGILAGALEQRLGVTILPYRVSEDDCTSIDTYGGGRTDGMILVAPRHHSPAISRVRAIGVPSVIVSAPGEEHGLSSIDVDNAAGIRLGFEHLVRLGHRRIAHIAGSADAVSTGQRRDAFVQLMQQHNLPLPDGYIQQAHYTGEKAAAAAKKLLSLPNPPTAILAGNDHIALETIRTAAGMGFSVPRQLSVVGFDDIAAASQLTPALTTIRQPLIEIGRRSVGLLVNSMALLPTEHALLAPSLQVRGTTATPVASLAC